MDAELSETIKRVNESYQRKKEEQTRIWRDFEQETKVLTDRVSLEFRKVLNENQLSYAQEYGLKEKFKVDIKWFQTLYNPITSKFNIRITKWGLVKPNGSFLEGGILGGPCAYICLEELTAYYQKFNPKIEEFMVNFHVHKIDFSCYCGSDHK
jgi:hypothetical protein